MQRISLPLPNCLKLSPGGKDEKKDVPPMWGYHMQHLAHAHTPAVTRESIARAHSWNLAQAILQTKVPGKWANTKNVRSFASTFSKTLRNFAIDRETWLGRRSILQAGMAQCRCRQRHRLLHGVVEHRETHRTRLPAGKRSRKGGSASSRGCPQ